MNLYVLAGVTWPNWFELISIDKTNLKIASYIKMLNLPNVLLKHLSAVRQLVTALHVVCGEEVSIFLSAAHVKKCAL